jgi:hypothetical protein
MRLRTWAGVGLVMIGCGGSAGQQPPAGAPTTRVEGSQPVAPGARPASDEIRKRWAFGDDVELTVFGDLAPFVRSELVSGVVPSILGLSAGSLSDVQRECVQGLIDGVGEVAIGANDKNTLLLLRYDERALKPGASTCLQAIGGGQPTQLPGATAAIVNEDDVIALQPGFVIAGSRKIVLEALKASGSGRWPSGFDLPKDTHLVWRARIPEEKVSASGSLASSRDFFHLDVKAELETEPYAAAIEAKIAEARKEIANRIAAEPKAKMALHVLDAMRVTREGRTLAFALDLREPPVDQARDVGVIVGMATSGVRKYIVKSKTAEARLTLAAIAKSESDAWRDLPPGKRKLASLPPVPKEVPRGTKYQSAPTDWKRWEAVKFSMKDPQYFQYEVVASKDGKRADIIARGDLNGDGKSSELTLKMNVNPKGNVLEVSSQIEEKDPEE